MVERLIGVQMFPVVLSAWESVETPVSATASMTQ